MNRRTSISALLWRRTKHAWKRRGAFLPVAAFSIAAAAGMVALGTDLSVISLTRTRMQNAVDAAALAASQEITSAVSQAGDQAANNGGSNVAGVVADANAIAVNAAKAMAVKVAQLNGVYVDPDRDVKFGKRYYSGGQWVIEWDVGPYNVVQVTARRDNPEPGHPDSKLDLFFAGVTGQSTATLTTSAIAFVEARDIVMVLDYSGSMNDDSTFSAFSKLGQTNVEANMVEIYNALAPNDGSLTANAQWLTLSGASGNRSVSAQFQNTTAVVTTNSTLTSIQLVFTDDTTQTFSASGTSKTVAGTGSRAGKTIDEVWVKTSAGGSTWTKLIDSTANVKTAFGLNSVSYPYASGSWDEYINYVRSDSTINNAGYRRKYGGQTFVHYLLVNKSAFNQCNKLWKTPHYPFHAMKQGATLFTQFLSGLEFGDELGLVTYDELGRVESVLNESGIPDTVNLGSDTITPNHAAINTIQIHKQAGHYYQYTNIADGILKGKDLLQSKIRYGARPTMLLMTDGNANRQVSSWSVPSGWNWNKLTDYDGDGVANYTTSDQNKLCAFVMAKQAVDAGIVIHTMTIGVDADRDLMKAIAFMGKGQWMDCPGGSTIAAIQSQLLGAFSKIAANVPPAKLLADPNAN